MHGLAAMLDHDDLGLDRDMREDPITMSDKESIKTSDILALLEAKYSSLQDRVLMEFASRVASESCTNDNILNLMDISTV